MFRNTMPRYEVLSEDAMATLDAGLAAARHRDRRRVHVTNVPSTLFRKAGQRVEENTVFLDPDFVLEQVAKAPKEFDVAARNPAHSCTSAATRWPSAPSTARPSSARATYDATRRWTTSATSRSWPSPTR